MNRFIILFILLFNSSIFLSAEQKELTLSQPDKEQILLYTRKLLNGQNRENLHLEPLLNQIQAPLIICLFSKNGKLLISKRIDDPALTLEQKINRAITKITQELNMDKDELRDAYIHIMVVSYTANFLNFGTKGFFNCNIY